MSLNFNTDQLVDDVIHFLSRDRTDNIQLLIDLVRDCNKSNPYTSTPEKYMWEEQCGINIPLLYISSLYLYKHAKAIGIDTYLFATRDCSHWVKIFNKMYPEEHAVYFDCSRNMLDSATKTYNEYYDNYVRSCLKTTPDRAIFIDVHGTGKRIIGYFKKRFGGITPYSFLLSSSYRKYVDFPNLTKIHHKEGKFINLIFDARGSPIEMLNYDVMGTLQSYNKHGSVRDTIEYSKKYLEAYHVCVEYILKYLKPADLDEDYDIEKLYKIIRKIYRVIQDNRPAISTFIKHPAKHPKKE